MIKNIDLNQKILYDQKSSKKHLSEDIRISGTIYTRDILYNRPYYMVMYCNNESEIISKDKDDYKIKWIAKNVSREFLDDDFLSLIITVRKIENTFKDIDALDIEFGIDSNHEVIIYQVKALDIISEKSKPMTDREFIDTKAFAKCNYLDTFQVLSDMAYCNPIEVMGDNPRPLDYSLYRELITKKIWSDGISTLGYEYVEDELMQKVGNKPYISVNYMFEGLTPKGLSSKFKYKLHSYYHEKLRNNREIHNNIEDKIVFSLYDFSTSDKLKELRDNGFTDEEIKTLNDALYNLTNKALEEFKTISVTDLEAINKLTNLRRSIRENAPLQETNTMKLYRYIHDLIESVKMYGAPQYARQARYAFMAKSLCCSMVNAGYFTQQEIESFLDSIPTVLSELEEDFDKYFNGNMTREDFNKLYGHLRVGTYDIRTDSYRDTEFDTDNKLAVNEKKIHEKYELDYERINIALDKIGFNISAKDFVEYVILATKNKEYFEFEYTKSLSLVLDIIIRMGTLIGIAREDMSYLEIQDLLSYHSRDSYIQIIQSRRDMYHAYMYLVLPDIIFSVGDIDVIEDNNKNKDFCKR